MAEKCLARWERFTWRILFTRPKLADKVNNGETDGEKQPSAISTDESPELKMLVMLNRRAIARLIKGEGFNKKELKDKTIHLDERAVRWLHRLAPLSWLLCYESFFLLFSEYSGLISLISRYP